MRLGHVSLGTTDLDRAIRFYVDVLGCEVAFEFVNPAGKRYGVFLALGVSGTFVEIFNKPGARSGEDRDSRFRHLCLEVDDVEAWAERFRAAGQDVECRRGRMDRTLGFAARDPDGNEIELHQYDPQSALWRHVRAARAGS